MDNPLRLGVNIDHVATLRNARGTTHPDPIQAAHIAASAGADGITVHLREDRRHIIDTDITRLSKEINLPLNMEMAATEEMLGIALCYTPHAACIVPENREERTTEGGLDLTAGQGSLRSMIDQMLGKDIQVSVFVEPKIQQLDAAKKIGIPSVELHTGPYCNAEEDTKLEELIKIRDAAAYAVRIGLECHAGHGLDFNTITSIAEIEEISEVNIGHFLIGESIYYGLETAIRRMRSLIDIARTKKLDIGNQWT